MLQDNDPKNVLKFPKQPRIPVPVDDILESARRCNLVDVAVLGHNQAGDIIVYTSNPYAPDNLWLLERGKQALLCGELIEADEDGAA